MKTFVSIIRVIVGVLFIFSGLVKANDPAGLSYKMHEFFEAWGMQGLNNYALTFSVLMIAFEIIAGVALLLGWQKKITLWSLLGLIVFFTFLTGYAWLAKKEDGTPKFAACGCFGDCIPLKPQESFFKDIALLVMILLLTFFQQYIQPIFRKPITWAILGLAILFSFFIQKYTLDHLPFKDCLSFKVGNNILEKKKFDAGKKEIIMVHEKDGKEYKYTLPTYPDWIEDTTYVFKRREEKILSTGNAGDMVLDFNWSTETGNDTTKAILEQNGEVALFILTNIEANGNYEWEKNFKKLLEKKSVVTEPAIDANDTTKNLNPAEVIMSHIGNKQPLYIITNKAEQARLFFKKYNVASNHIFFCDEKPLLAAARTRPTLMILNKGKIVVKLTWKDMLTVFK